MDTERKGKMQMDSLQELKEKIDAFAKERDWEKFHTPENLAKSISIEANELLECFQWSGDTYSIKKFKKDIWEDMRGFLYM